MRTLLTIFLALLVTDLCAQWSRSYPQAQGYDHQIYLEGYELPVMTAGPMDPAPAPDGRHLAFAAKGWLWLLDMESGVARRLTQSGGMDSRPEWSPDGERLVFIRDVRTHLQIVMLDLDSGDETVLIDSEAINLDPVFGPRGNAVFYSSAEGGPIELWKVDVDSLHRTRISSSPAVLRRTTKRRPQVVDPDSLVAYLYKQNYYDAIELLNTRTQERTTLVSDRIAPQADLSLSPDGTHIAYTWPNDDDGHDLRLLALADTSSTVLLTRGNGLPLAPQFSYDGQWIYFAQADADERMGIWRVGFGGGAPEPVAVREWDWGVPTGTITLRSEVDGEPSPVRISVTDESGHPLVPEHGIIRFEGQNKRVYFYSQGTAEITAPVGEINVAAVHGFETPEVSETARIRRGGSDVTLRLERVWDPSEAGWYAAENHFHLNYGGHLQLEPADIVAEMRAEAMDLGYLNVANMQNRFLQEELIAWRRSELPIIEFGQEVRAHMHGHINLLGIDEAFWPWVWGPLYQVYGRDDRLNVEATQFARERGGLSGYVHPVDAADPFQEQAVGSTPGTLVADAVLGQSDIIELACLWTSSVGTAAVWHAILNLGIPLAASAGSDVMNDLYRMMSIGATRVYVKPRGDLTDASYLEALKGGRSFVTTGPLLEFEAAGQGPGGVIEAPGEAVDWRLDVHSAVPFERVQIFVNGEVVAEYPGSETAGTRGYEGSVTVPAGGWVTARVLGDSTGWPVQHSGLYAETSPVWFFAVGSTEPGAERSAREKLLRELNAKEQALTGAYDLAETPRLRAHFAAARKRLESQSDTR